MVKISNKRLVEIQSIKFLSHNMRLINVVCATSKASDKPGQRLC